jgi:ribulose-phosphate 3-epimerase
MRAYVSLWSADLLAVGDAVRVLEGAADGFHVDVFDGHNVRDLLFGPDFVAALRRRTSTVIDVHLNVDDPGHWSARFINVGADVITVQASACDDVMATLAHIRERGTRAGLGLERSDDVSTVADLVPHVDRILVMGTQLGVKGADLDAATYEKVSRLRRLCDRLQRRPEIVVDGGIREHTVPRLAAAGADGVVPGSLVLSAPDPKGVVDWVHAVSSESGVDSP